MEQRISNRNRCIAFLQLILLIALSVALYQEKQKIRRFNNRTPEAQNSYFINYQDAYRRPPVSGELFVPRAEDHDYLESQLKLIFPDEQTKYSDEEKAIAIMKYISTIFTLKNNEGTATKLLKERYAICGGMNAAFITLARKAGIPARFVGSMYFPRLRSHAIAELYYDQRWHLYDATFGIFFYSRSNYDGQGYIASFHDLVLNDQEWIAFKVVEQPWQVTYDERVRNFPVVPAGVDYLKKKYGIGVPDIYLSDFKDSFPIAYGENDLVSYPVDIDMSDKNEEWFGKLDKNNRELSSYNSRFSGSGYLGNSTPVGYHTLLIRSPKYSRLKIDYFSTTPITKSKLQLTPLRALKLIDKNVQSDRITFTVVVIDDQAIASIFCPSGTFFIDAIRVEKLNN